MDPLPSAASAGVVRFTRKQGGMEAMGYYRQMRKKDELHIDGPAVVIIERGRVSVTVEADRTTTINHKKRRKRLAPQPRKP
jgi:hypothetical protein